MGREHNRAIFRDTILPKNVCELKDHYLVRSIESYSDFIEKYSRLAKRTLEENGVDPEEDLDVFFDDPNRDAAIYEARQLLLFCMTLEHEVERLRETQKPKPKRRWRDEPPFMELLNTALSMAAGIADLGAKIAARASEPDALRGRKNRNAGRRGGRIKRRERKPHWDAMQAEVDRLSGNGFPRNVIVTAAARKFYCSPKTIRRHTTIKSS